MYARTSERPFGSAAWNFALEFRSRTTLSSVVQTPSAVCRWKNTTLPANELEPVTLVEKIPFWKPSPTRGCTLIVIPGVCDVLVLAVYVVSIPGVTLTVQLPLASEVVVPAVWSTMSSGERARIVIGSPAFAEETVPVSLSVWQQMVSFIEAVIEVVTVTG